MVSSTTHRGGSSPAASGDETGTSAARGARGRARPSGALIAADLVALVGTLLAGISLFLHDWVHVTVAFDGRGRIANWLFQSIGVDVDQPLARVATREANATVPPTLWQYPGHAFRWVFALLVCVAVLLLVAFCVPRVRAVVHAGALLLSSATVTISLIALVRLDGRSETVPARVGRAILDNRAVTRALGLTTGRPQLSDRPGWPLYMGAAGLAFVLLGVLVGLIFAAARPPRKRRIIANESTHATKKVAPVSWAMNHDATEPSTVHALSKVVGRR